MCNVFLSKVYLCDLRLLLLSTWFELIPIVENNMGLVSAMVPAGTIATTVSAAAGNEFNPFGRLMSLLTCRNVDYPCKHLFMDMWNKSNNTQLVMAGYG